MSTDTPETGDVGIPERPEDVHPEHDHPTPENLDDWSEEQVNLYNTLVEQDIDESLEERQEELDERQEQAIAALTNPTDDDYAEVTINDGETVRVKTYLNERMETLFDTISNNPPKETVGEMKEAIAWFVEDDSPYADPAVWAEYKRMRGAVGLFRVFEQVTQPAIDRLQGRDAVGNSDGPTGDS